MFKTITQDFNMIIVSSYFASLKARSNGSNMLLKHYPTLLGGVGRCLINVGLCWMLECSNESNTIQQCWISVPGTKLWRIFDHANENVGQCWMKGLTKVKHHPAPSNMFDLLFDRVKHVASNNV